MSAMSRELFVSPSPRDVTVRERLVYAFDFSDRLGEGESVSAPAAILLDAATKQEVAGVLSNVVAASPDVNVTADWTVEGVQTATMYLLIVTATIGARREDAILEARTLWV